MRNLFVCFLVAALGLALDSCNKPDPIHLAQEGTIYMPQAVGTQGTLSLYLLDSAQLFYFGAAYGGLGTPSSDINVNFVIDSGAIAKYNAANGTAYVMMPDKSYTISGLASTIKAGQTSSSALTLSVLAKQLLVGTKYMLPVKMTSISGGKLDSGLQTTYFKVDSIFIRKRDITAQGKLAVSDENTYGASSPEGSPHLVDNDITTKFLSFNYNPNFWFQLQFPTAQVVNEYTFTSGNDSPGRDPKDWNLEGSNDGTNWTQLDNRSSEAFDSRQETKSYTFSNNTAYTYYRVNVTANNGDGLFQMSEWRVIQYY
jgi:hypothetical protein